MSRRPTVVIAYLMAMKGMSLGSALLYVQARRKIADPNWASFSVLDGGAILV